LFDSIYRPVSLLEEIEEMTTRLWESWSPLFVDFTPTVDVYEEDGQMVVKTEIVGVEQGDIDISLNGNVLTIKAEKKSEERVFGRYARSVTLPSHVNAEKAEASFDEGILEIRLPKVNEAKKIEFGAKAQLELGEKKNKQRKSKKAKATKETKE